MLWNIFIWFQVPRSHSENSLRNQDVPVEISNDAVKLSKKPKGSSTSIQLPYWYIYVAWSLVCLTCVVSVFFVVLYGLQFGKVVSYQWLSSMTVSFVQDVLISEPLKVSWTLLVLLPSTRSCLILGQLFWFLSSIIQIMNVYSCNGKNIFVRWKMECSIQRGDSRVRKRMRSILTDAIYRKHKECNGIKHIVQLHSQRVQWNVFHCTLGKWHFLFNFTLP